MGLTFNGGLVKDALVGFIRFVPGFNKPFKKEIQEG